MFIKDVHAAIYMNASLIPPSLESEEGASERCTENSDELLGIVVINSLGWVSAVDSEGRTIWIDDAHRDDGKRFVARSDKMLTAFIELESAIRVACGC
jgi:hypothetical protein